MFSLYPTKFIDPKNKNLRVINLNKFNFFFFLLLKIIQEWVVYWFI